MNTATTVRILRFHDNHPDAYARLDNYDRITGIVHVSNMNMPYQGSLAHARFHFNEVEFIIEKS